MTRKPKAKPAGGPKPPAPTPVDVHDGIPDCSSRRPVWRWVLMVGVFGVWLTILVYCWLSGNLPTQ